MKFSWDNTANIKKLAATVDLSTPAGKERFQYEIGDTVISSNLGMYRAGCEFVITDRYMENGFAYYKEGDHVHRTKDIQGKKEN